jgi:hypothetical protein
MPRSLQGADQNHVRVVDFPGDESQRAGHMFGGGVGGAAHHQRERARCDENQ